MEMISQTNEPNCAEVRDLLSDMLEVYDGELPHPDGTRLAEPGVRAAVEFHLASCEYCRAELHELQEIGRAFSDFSVGDVSPQHFENYGEIVRQRMNQNRRPTVIQVKPSRWREWAVMGSTGLAAALVAFFVMRGQMTPPDKKTNVEVAAAEPSTIQAPPAVVPPIKSLQTPTPLEIRIPRGVTMVTQDFIHNPKSPETTLRRFQNDEGQYGYLILGEKGDALLGAYLKTTRDVDRIKDKDITGLMVYGVVAGSMAAKMGLQRNDLIISINDLPVTGGGLAEAANFFGAVKELGAGAQVVLQVARPVGDQFKLLKPMYGVLGKPEKTTETITPDGINF